MMINLTAKEINEFRKLADLKESKPIKSKFLTEQLHTRKELEVFLQDNLQELESHRQQLQKEMKQLQPVKENALSNAKLLIELYASMQKDISQNKPLNLERVDQVIEERNQELSKYDSLIESIQNHKESISYVENEIKEIQDELKTAK